MCKNKVVWYINKYFAPSSETSPGGRDWNLMKMMARQGCQPVVISSDSNTAWDTVKLSRPIEIECRDGVNLVYLKTYKYLTPKSIKRVLSWFHFEWNVFWFDKSDLPKPDAVVASSLSLLTIFNGYLLSRKYGCKFIFEVRDIWPLTIIEENGFSMKNPLVWMLAQAEKFGYKKADAIIGTMPNLEEHVRRVSSSKAPVYCIPMGISDDYVKNSQPLTREYKKKYLSSHKMKVVHAGAVGITNALDVFFKAAEKLKDNERLEFILVGDGVLKEKYQHQFGHLPNLIFAPKVTKYQVQAVLAECDVVYFSTFPSKVWEYGQSLNKVVDYMYSGKPIIASYSGYPSMINEAECGCFLPAGDVDALVKKLIEYAALSKFDLSEKGRKGKDWILKNRNYQKLAKAMSSVCFN